MKKIALLIFAIGIFINLYSQNDSIGEYLMYYNSNDYYLTFYVNEGV